ncbi:MAG: hypothetical protein IT382_09900 [Deltaproteobacteria bacterium]|nr:hypothetical protein [Deltaproteobacteria bacterium]
MLRALLLLAAASALSMLACQDPCVALAERICSCEPTASDRQTCRTYRVVNQQSQVQIDDADRDFCEAKLQTCSCGALDENDLDACGFVVAAEEP